MITHKKELKKNIATIHCANSLSLLQRKISNALLFQAYPNLQSQEEHTVSIKKLCEIIGYAGHNTDAIKKAIKGLITTLVEWNLIDESGQEDWSASTMLASVRLYQGKCVYAYSPRMRSLLFSPKIYGKISIAIQSKFKSSYGLALYENCIRYQGLPQTRWFEMEVFRKLMGVPENQYQIFRDFNRRVLTKAVAEVNLYSDLTIDCDLLRQGRAVTAIRFKLKEIKNTEMPILPETTQKNDCIDEDAVIFDKLLSQFAISETKARKILNEYESCFVKEKMQMIENSKPYKEGKIANMGGYLVKALKEDYKNHNELQVKSKIKQQENIIQQQQEVLQKNYNDYVKQQIENYILNLNENTKQELLMEFETDYLTKDTFAFARAKKFGVEDYMIKALFKKFINDNCNIEYLTFQEWNDSKCA